uniref:Uncharacterized protein n=1 Tax=Oryza nivara TaxID=4536 RepID=A0A0E0HNV6_ORYNI
MKSADGRASVRCGGCCVLPYGLRQKPSSVVHRAGSGYAFGCRNLLGCCRGWAMVAFLDVVTTVVASFLEPLLCGVAIGLAASGHA